MGRASKDRRNEILDIAGNLFKTKGFKATSTNKILNELGIARGTLYHHFKSKEEIAIQYIKRENEKLIINAQKAADDKSLDVLDRFFNTVKAIKIDDKQLKSQIHAPENTFMHCMIMNEMLNGVTPILANLVVEGIEKNIFKTDFPYEAVEMILSYSSFVLDDNHIVNLSTEDLDNKIVALIDNSKKLLGCSSDEFEVKMMAVLSDER